MPMYAYECKDCGVYFERRQSFNDEPITDCPECGGAVRRLIQPAGIVFKGSGFYVTDNKKAKSPTSTSASSMDKSNSNGAESRSDSGSTSDSSSDSASSASEKTASPSAASD